MQRFEELKVDNKIISNSKPIENWLLNSEYHWLLDCEVDNVKLEIKDNILYWKSGILYWGKWKWGVWESGEFRSGDWYGGIFMNGIFKGKWHNGVFKHGEFKGEKLGGSFPNEKIE